MGRLFWKLFLAFWLALLAAGGAVGVGVWLHNQAERAEMAERAERAERDEVVLRPGGPRAGMVLASAAAILRHEGEAALAEYLAGFGRQPRLARLLVVEEASGRELLDRPVAAEMLAEARSLAASPGRGAAQRVRAPDGRFWLVFIAADPTRPLAGRDFHRPQPPSPFIPILAGLFASLAFSALFARYLSRPVRSLRWALDAVAAGELGTRVQPLMGRRRDEIADLGRDFDHMAERLQTLVQARQRLLHDVSHELRSPLARLQAAIGLARQNPLRREDMLERIERESARLDELVGELLTLSRLEADSDQAAVETIDIMELLADVAADARFEAQAAGKDLVFAGEGELVAAVRPELLHRAFENVLRNAVEYTAPGSSVEVAARQEGGRWLVAVSDRGPGVREEELEAIFLPFHRGEGGQALPGFGLGLAIARRAVELHGGSIRAANRVGGGLAVEMRFPLA